MMPENTHPWARLVESKECFFYLGKRKLHIFWSTSPLPATLSYNNDLHSAGSSLYPSVTLRPDLMVLIYTGNEGMKKKTHLTVKDITVFLQSAKLLKECRNNKNWSFLAAFEQIGVLGEWMKEWEVCQRRMEPVGFPKWQAAVSVKYRCHTGVKRWKTQPSSRLSQLAPHLLWDRGFSDHRPVCLICLMWSASLLHWTFVTQITLLCLAPASPIWLWIS